MSRGIPTVAIRDVALLALFFIQFSCTERCSQLLGSGSSLTLGARTTTACSTAPRVRTGGESSTAGPHSHPNLHLRHHLPRIARSLPTSRRPQRHTPFPHAMRAAAGGAASTCSLDSHGVAAAAGWRRRDNLKSSRLQLTPYDTKLACHTSTRTWPSLGRH